MDCCTTFLSKIYGQWCREQRESALEMIEKQKREKRQNAAVLKKKREVEIAQRKARVKEALDAQQQQAELDQLKEVRPVPNCYFFPA